MMIKSATWNLGGDTIAMSMDICKVDQEQRLVHGWATLNNLDSQGDVVTKEASQSAFSRFRGNIREMHEKIAAGRMVSYRPQTLKTDDGNTYEGIFVSAYISKGAEPTWQKVLDGTLSMFSIKGPIKKHRVVHDGITGKSYREIQDYDLEELSLVDSGGNQFADVVLIQKDGAGMYNDIIIENVFLCEEDRIAETSQEETLKCQNGHEMKNIGWVEAGSSKMEKVMDYVDEYFKKTEGGVEEMAEKTVEKAVDVDEAGTEEVVEVVAEEVSMGEEVTDEGVNEAEETEGAPEAAEVDLEKFAEEFLVKVTDGIAAGIAEVITSLTEKFTALEETVAKRLDEADAKVTETEKSVTEVKESLSEVSKSVDELEEETALKKSGDLGGSSEPVVKKTGVWQGSIL